MAHHVADYFTGKGVKGWVVKNFMTAVGTIPVDRSGGQASLAALQAGIARLSSGELFGIYPEGTRSPDGRLYRGKTRVSSVKKIFATCLATAPSDSTSRCAICPLGGPSAMSASASVFRGVGPSSCGPAELSN